MIRNESVLMTVTLDRVYDPLDYCVISNNALVVHENNFTQRDRRQMHIAVQAPKGMASICTHRVVGRTLCNRVAHHDMKGFFGGFVSWNSIFLCRPKR